MGHLQGIKGFKLSHVQQGVKTNYAYFPVIFDGYKYARDEMFEKLKEQDLWDSYDFNTILIRFNT